MSNCYCDFDPPEIYVETWPKARREYFCCECGHKINRGEVYNRITGKWEGVFDTFKTCEKCADLRDSLMEVMCVSIGGLQEAYEYYRGELV